MDTLAEMLRTAADKLDRVSLLEGQLAEAQKRIQSLTGDVSLLQGQIDAIDDVLPVFTSGSILDSVVAMLAEMKELEASNEAQANTIKELAAKLEALEEPPVKPDDTVPIVLPTDPVIKPPVPELPHVPTVPDPPTPEPVQKLRNVRGVIITKDEAPSPRQDEMTRDLIDLCGKMGFTHWRGLLNFEEVAKQRKLPASDPANLPAYGRAHGMAYVADSVDSQMKRLLALSARQTYFEGLKELGAVAVYFDDVDKADKAPFIHEWLAFARDGMKAANFKVPLIGSFTANVKRGVYDVDEIEIQTYGNLGNFKEFLTRDADILCIDGRQRATLEYVKAMTALVAAQKRDFFVYAARSRDGTDWRLLPALVDVYGAFLKDW